MMKHYGLIALSGGQGKTTLAMLLSMYLARSGKKVLLIDADPQANATLYCRITVEKDSPTLLEVITESTEALDAVVETETENLYVIPADRRLSKAQVYLQSTGNPSTGLSLVLESISPYFDFAVIDSPPSASAITAAVAGASDRVLVPVIIDPKGEASADETLLYIEDLRRRGGCSCEVDGLFPMKDVWRGQYRTLDCRESLNRVIQLGQENGMSVFDPILDSVYVPRSIHQMVAPQDSENTNVLHVLESFWAVTNKLERTEELVNA